MNRPSRETVERRREMYPPGTRGKLIHMDDPYNQVLKPGCLAQWISWMTSGHSPCIGTVVPLLAWCMVRMKCRL